MLDVRKVWQWDSKFAIRSTNIGSDDEEVIENMRRIRFQISKKYFSFQRIHRVIPIDSFTRDTISKIVRKDTIFTQNKKNLHKTKNRRDDDNIERERKKETETYISVSNFRFPSLYNDMSYTINYVVSRPFIR